jgi:hypothetical protein
MRQRPGKYLKEDETDRTCITWLIVTCKNRLAGTVNSTGSKIIPAIFFRICPVVHGADFI